jgi:dTDP-4-dehydrorhamnose 3,5-epimerase
MTPLATPLAGAFVIDAQRFEDERGFFARPYDQPVAFAQLGLARPVVEANISYNRRRGTLRGMHFQVAPKSQPKLVRCTAGAIWDCIIDLRPDSPTHRRWFGAELSAENRRGLFVPAGFAHGFIALADHTEVLYLMHEAYAPDLARGVRWNDSAFAIPWPLAPTVINDRDNTYADYK